MIIYYLASKNNIHRRPESTVHHTGDDFLLGNLKFVPKGETDEVFGMAIPKQLITEAIQQSSYYQKYLEMIAKNTKKTPQESEGKQPEPATKREPAKRPTTTKPAPAKQPKSPKKKPSKRIPTRKVRKGKIQFDHVDEEDIKKEPKPQGKGDDPVLELVKKMSLDSLQGKGKEEGADADYELAVKMSLDSIKAQSQAPVGGVSIRECVAEEIRNPPEVEGKRKAIVKEEQAAHSLIDLSKKKKSGTKATTPKVDKERGKEASTTVTSEERMAVCAEDQAGSDPGKGNVSTEYQVGPDPGERHAALAGPDPEPMHDDFYAMAYPKVHENLKLRTDKHVIVENPKSPYISYCVATPVVDLTSTSHPPVSAPLLTTTTETTTILALPPPPPSQSATDSGLAARVAELEKRNAELECVFIIHNKTTNNLASRIFTLEHRDLEYRIDNYVCDAVKDCVQAALRAPLL
ncbi:hypothetical protein Tco_0652281 [Tanacetum coccineum]|uniref:Histone deacetylase 14 n=1 Tax=Tanacetum coccineum TaxID=301880 RepID=A0ABQ4WX54_9ASTR